MKRTLLLVVWQIGMLAGTRLYADVVTLKDGRQISGQIETGNTQELRIKVADQSQAIEIDQVQSIQFGVSLPAPAPPPARTEPAPTSILRLPGPPAPAAAAPAPPAPRPAPTLRTPADTAPAAPTLRTPDAAAAPAAPTLRTPDAAAAPAGPTLRTPDAPPASAAAPGSVISLPVGTEIAVRTIDRIDSKKASLSHEYAASLDDPVIVDGVEVVPANANAFLRVTEAKSPSLTHRAAMSMQLVAIVVNGQKIKVETGNVDSQAGSQAKRTAVGGAVGAGTGAAIGAAAGGGAGAAVGAGAGAAAGAVAGKLTGKGVEVAPETRFTYKLTQPAAINPQEAK